jgi:hypothetical protein
MKFELLVKHLLNERVYHGSPHDIKGSLNLKNVGTGEGVQVYGWGLYFAENPDVAETYKKIGSDRYTNPNKPEGNFYEVNINADPENDFLNWDRLISQQSTRIQNIIKRYNLENDITGEEFYKKLIGTRHGDRGPEMASKQLLLMGIKGIRYYDQFSRMFSKPEFDEDFGKWVVEWSPGNFNAFENEADALKYANRTDRTHNYVVFDPKILKIVSKNGQAVLKTKNPKNVEIK